MYRAKLHPEKSSWRKVVAGAEAAELVIAAGSSSNEDENQSRAKMPPRDHRRGGRFAQNRRSEPMRTSSAEIPSSPQKRNELLAAGLCFNCEQSGHMARNCPKMSSKVKGKAPGFGTHSVGIPSNSVLVETTEVIETLDVGAIRLDVEKDENSFDPNYGPRPKAIGDLTGWFDKKFESVLQVESDPELDINDDDGDYGTFEDLSDHDLGDEYCVVALGKPPDPSTEVGALSRAPSTPRPVIELKAPDGTTAVSPSASQCISSKCKRSAAHPPLERPVRSVCLRRKYYGTDGWRIYSCSGRKSGPKHGPSKHINAITDSEDAPPAV
ncbi:hypothetical protein B0H14DRAFT_3477177 [Mycena olivaceomarginata]|nr:hypothetical protein B0H14DRAFT_3477177 [Mycena olivaceomarginata]